MVGHSIALHTGLPAEGFDGSGPEGLLPVMEPFLHPDGPDTPRGAVIVCPGGGYNHRAQHEGAPVAEWLNAIGLHAFVLHYRVAPTRHPGPLSDVRRAVRHVRQFSAEWGVKPDRIAVLGFSAGGHLAASAGILWEPGQEDAADPVERISSRPDGMILCYPVVSFGEYRHPGSLACLLGDNPPEELIRDMSLETRADAATPPAFIWHTADDAKVPVENSLLLAGALSRAGVPFELHVFPHGRHGLGLAREHEQAKSWTGLCRVWLEKNGFIDEGCVYKIV